MPKIKINLEEILITSKFHNLTKEEIEFVKEGLIPFSFSEIIRAMQEACHQVLELAAENADVTINSIEDLKLIVDKQSILNTINQIE